MTGRAILIIGAVASLAVAAQHAPTLVDAHPGLWEIEGAPGATGTVRQCVADIRALARFEHRGRTCSTKPSRTSGSATFLDYSCEGAGFGHSEVTVLTPRSLRISTQGIGTDGLPFNYVLQARRVGDCSKNPTAAHH